MKRKQAFTIIELLVVIAIIAVLAAILFPVFSRARESGYQTAAMTQARQLGIAMTQYLAEHDQNFLPSTNYGLPEDNPNRMWPAGLLPFIKDERIFVAPGTDGKFPKTWAERSLMTVGYNSSTAIDTTQGCEDGQKDTTGCLAFKKAHSFSKEESPSQAAFFALTPGGPEAEKYRGYEFSPFNGVPHPEDLRLSPPLVSDRDLVKEMGPDTEADLMKPIYARYGATGNDDGSTPIIFGDGHAKSYTAKAIQGMETGIVWRFR